MKLAILMLIGALGANGGEGARTRLSCDGRVWTDVLFAWADTNGLSVRIGPSTVSLDGPIPLPSDYVIARNSDSALYFTHGENIGGSLNRFTGEMFLYEKDTPSDRNKVVYLGKCVPAKPLF